MLFLESTGVPHVVGLEQLEAELEQHFPSLHAAFRKKWSNLEEKDKGVIVFDGGMKVHRRVCCEPGCAGDVGAEALSSVAST